jgi:hypothetical protein
LNSLFERPVKEKRKLTTRKGKLNVEIHFLTSFLILFKFEFLAFFLKLFKWKTREKKTKGDNLSERKVSRQLTEAVFKAARL